MEKRLKYARVETIMTQIPEKLTKPYNPHETEQPLYEKWEQSGYFNPDNLPDARENAWSTIMPPPNANGRLHAGHGLDMTLKDIVTRFKRMQGYRALFLPGADHAGFETQIVYEKQLEKEGRSRFKMDPNELYQEILNFTLENKQYMEEDVRRIGTSCDWSREKFTLDPDIVQQVHLTFKKMFDDGLVYRGQRIVNWCSKHQTSLSEVETEFVEQKDPFYYFQYGPFVIGTARPETKFGDKYVVMHPDDDRYKDYEHGQTIDVEWINGPITATIIKDEAIDMEFGTGVMTITPWHDPVDFDIAERHNLDKEQVIDEFGKLLPIAGEFEGMKITEAREKIVEKLDHKGLLVKTDGDYVHNVKVCYKCSRTIEPQIRDQWFIKMKPLADMAKKAVEEGKVTFVTKQFEKIFFHWMNNPIDWNISRQIVWGISIPAKLCDACNDGFVDIEDAITTCPTCGGAVHKDPDTFDTWFSSGQWPVLALGYPDNPDFTTYYPTQLMETGRDLIFKWIPRMVMFGMYLTDKEPFQTVYLHGMINDEKNQKMSKSKGNVMSPVDLIDEFGADAYRMGIVVGNTPGNDMALSKDKVNGYKKFANKIWNASRFVLENTSDIAYATQPTLSEKDRTYLRELAEMTQDITSDIEEYRFHLASEKIYHYFWHQFADIIIEEIKNRINNPDTSVEDILSGKWTLLHILSTSLKLLHPFMPFVTEELWQHMPSKQADFLMIEKWPDAETPKAV